MMVVLLSLIYWLGEKGHPVACRGQGRAWLSKLNYRNKRSLYNGTAEMVCVCVCVCVCVLSCQQTTAHLQGMGVNRNLLHTPATHRSSFLSGGWCQPVPGQKYVLRAWSSWLSYPLAWPETRGPQEQDW